MLNISAAKCPVTKDRPPAIDTHKYIENPGVARASIAASKDVPGGSEPYSSEHADLTVLQQHVLFWDRNSDNVITPWDTYVGFRDLGFNMLFSLVAVAIINVNFSYPTRLGHYWLPDPFFRVYVDSIHKAKHGSDAGVLDNEGRFVPQNFENLFSKYDKNGTGSLSLRELFDLMHGQRCATDPFGWGAALFEWCTTWLLIQRDGNVWKEDLRQIYDGSMFWRIKAERAKKNGWNQGYGYGGDGFWESEKKDILINPIRSLRSFTPRLGLTALLSSALTIATVSLSLLALPSVPSIITRRPAGKNVLESAWIPRACPSHSGTILQPISTEEVASIIKSSLQRCPIALGSAPGSKHLSIRASKQLYHSSVTFPCVNIEAGNCAVQLDLSRMSKFVSADPSALRITVQPGMHIDELMETMHDFKMGVPTDYIPIYTGLSVGGMLLSGAHGSSTERPSAFGHLVTRVTYVDGKGEIHEEHNITNWIGSLGMLGVVTEMDIAAVEAYKLNTTTIKESDAHLPERLAKLMLEPAFSRVMWYPNAHTALVRYHSWAPPDTPGDAYHAFFENRPWAAVGGQISLALDQINFTPFPTDRGICLFARHPPPFWYKDGKYGRWLEFNQSIIGWAHRLGGSSCRGSQWGCYWRNQIQMLVEFDMDVSVLGDWVRDVRALTDMVEAKGCLPSLLGFAMRFGKASNAPMDMGYGRDTVYIDMLVAKGIASLPAHHQDVLDEIEQMTFCRYGARPHWGKNTERIFLNPNCPVRDKYPEFDRFLEMAEASDPRGIFRSPMFQRIVDRDSYSQYPGCVSGDDCYCQEDRHCGPTALFRCGHGRREKNVSVCVQRFGRQ